MKQDYKKVIIFAAIHGDEVYGVELYKSFIKAHPQLKDFVSLVIGNKLAYEKKTRFIDVDMNRAYGSNKPTHELIEIKRTKKEIELINPDYILDIHTTRRSSGTFFITDSLDGVKQTICNMLDIDICVMKHGYIHTSFVGTYNNCVSLEYSLASISDKATRSFIHGLKRLIENKPLSDQQYSRKTFELTKLISEQEYTTMEGLKSYDVTPLGVALMVPKNKSEMDAEYYGFWCKEVDNKPK